MKQTNLNNFLRIIENRTIIEGALFFDGDEESLIGALAEIAEEEIVEDGEIYKDVLFNNRMLYKRDGDIVELKSVKISFKFLRRVRCGWLADWADAQDNQKCDVFEIGINLLIKKDNNILKEDSINLEVGYEYSWEEGPEDFANLLRFARDNHSINLIFG